MIILLPLITWHGFTITDSAFYLGQARNFADAASLHIHGIYNSSFPPGYPIAIGFVSKISGLDVFWSSKALNIICLICLVILLWSVSKDVTVMGALFLATILSVMLYTLSELLFITLLIATLLLFWRTIQSKSWWIHFLIIVPAFSLVFVRYVGLMIIPLWFFVLLYSFYSPQYSKKYKISAVLAFLVFLIFTSSFFIIQSVISGDPAGDRAE